MGLERVAVAVCRPGCIPCSRKLVAGERNAAQPMAQQRCSPAESIASALGAFGLFVVADRRIEPIPCPFFLAAGGRNAALRLPIMGGPMGGPMGDPMGDPMGAGPMGDPMGGPMAGPMGGPMVALRRSMAALPMIDCRWRHSPAEPIVSVLGALGRPAVAVRRTERFPCPLPRAAGALHATLRMPRRKRRPVWEPIASALGTLGRPAVAVRRTEHFPCLPSRAAGALHVVGEMARRKRGPVGGPIASVLGALGRPAVAVRRPERFPCPPPRAAGALHAALRAALRAARAALRMARRKRRPAWEPIASALGTLGRPAVAVRRPERFPCPSPRATGGRSVQVLRA